jgi:nitrite reductase/ring-hydroxylating ferredoxin subunit
MSRERNWQDLIAVADLEAGDVTPVQFGNRELAVFDTLDGVTVSMARCTHGAANLCDGYFSGTHIECPLHQGLFDARTGDALAAPAHIGGNGSGVSLSHRSLQSKRSRRIRARQCELNFSEGNYCHAHQSDYQPLGSV